ncbi:ArsA-related P-loop ATPase [Oryzobacter terrae]|uniref:ArsA-related P-loop ATPase n=1 Tax=Oryzobacter terrae TaxID=1620385 RepID=UPI00366CC8FC
MANPPLPRVLDGVRLHVVTGKGGVGKTTVAAALALALSRQGRRVLLVEVEGRQGISQTFDVPPLGTEEVRLVSHAGGGELWGLSVDAKAALLEYLQTFYKLGRAGGALERMGVVDFATTVAPGVRDVLLTGKVYEAVGRTTGPKRGQGRKVWDAVVLDAPPTGRVARFLAVNVQVADLARIGPIHGQAESITRMLKDRQTLVHVVTLLEEMPVQETADAVAELSAEGFGLGAVVVNQVREPLVDEALLELAATDGARVEARVRDDLASAGVRASARTVTGLLAQGHNHAARVALEHSLEDEVASLGLAVVTLPALASGVEDGGIAVLADELAAQGAR